jgi:thiamine-monophosphate kinase
MEETRSSKEETRTPQEETRFADIGKREAVRRLYEGTPFREVRSVQFAAAGAGDTVRQASKLLLEGIDFDLVYFPLKHLGYKAVVAVTGELLAALAHPKVLSLVLGISAKLDFAQIREIWGGVVAAAREYGYADVALDLVPSRNGLAISLSATGSVSQLTARRRPAPKSKDLLCVSGSLGAAYLGFRLLEREKRAFEAGKETSLETYRMLVGAYLKPELPAGVVSSFEDAEIYPSAGCLVTHGLADAVKRLALETGLGAKIYAEKIPFEGNSFQLGKELDVDPVAAAMNGGDDYKLLFAVPILHLEKFRRDFQTFDIVGHLAQSDAGTTLVLPEGAELPLRAPGWPED